MTFAAAPRPNILFILADDLGWADVGYNGGGIRTPHLDALAARGTRLTQFYVQPLCTPTRASLMTGRYPMRLGLQSGVIKPGAEFGLPLAERTLATALRGAGYTTALCGKWHLGHHDPAYLPTARGFDHQYGLYNGSGDYFTHERDGGLDWHRDDRPLREEGYATHLIAREAARLIAGHDGAGPLFLHVAFSAPHSPLQVPETYTAPYRHLKEDRRNYAGMVAALDEAVGQVIAALEKSGMRQDTLIIFSSDNGGHSPGKISDNGPWRAGKGTLYEGGVRVPAFAVWEGKLKPGSTWDGLMHITDWHVTLLRLAGAAPAPLPLDGLDVWSALSSGGASPRDELLHNASAESGALRSGDWKLVLNGHLRDTGDPARADAAAASASPSVEMFNIARDPYERENLAGQFPAELRRLRARYDELAAQAAPLITRPPPPGFKVPRVWGAAEK